MGQAHHSGREERVGGQQGVERELYFAPQAEEAALPQPALLVGHASGVIGPHHAAVGEVASPKGPHSTDEQRGVMKAGQGTQQRVGALSARHSAVRPENGLADSSGAIHAGVLEEEGLVHEGVAGHGAARGQNGINDVRIRDSARESGSRQYYRVGHGTAVDPGPPPPRRCF